MLNLLRCLLSKGNRALFDFFGLKPKDWLVTKELRCLCCCLKSDDGDDVG